MNWDLPHQSKIKNLYWETGEISWIDKLGIGVEQAGGGIEVEGNERDLDEDGISGSGENWYLGNSKESTRMTPVKTPGNSGEGAWTGYLV